jgi:hypothetical protein
LDRGESGDTLGFLGFDNRPSMTDVRIPVMSAEIMTTTPTPIATPRIVRPERTLLVPMEPRAILTPSLSVVRPLISVSLVTFTSLVPQGVDGGELGGPHRWVYAGNHPHDYA